MSKVVKCTWLALFFLITAQVHAGPSGTIRGLVFSVPKRSATPLPGARVQIVGTKFEVLTDHQGHYEITVPPGRYTLLITKDAYEPAFLEHIVVREGKATDVKKELRPKRNLEKRIFKPAYLSVEALYILLDSYRSDAGKVEPNPPLGLLTATDYPDVLHKMERLLKEHDVPPRQVSLMFKLIGAARENGKKKLDSQMKGIVRELEKLFQFKGYTLLGSASARTQEGNAFLTTLPVFIGKSNGIDFTVTGAIEYAETPKPVVKLRGFELSMAKRVEHSAILATSINIPVGDTVVLGSTSSVEINALLRADALIVVVSAEVVE